MRFTITEVVRVVGGRAEGAPAGREVVVTGVSTDTRTLRPGDLFVPLRGPQRDGHGFIAEAFARGAAASLAAHPVRRVPGPLIHVDDALRALGALAGEHRRSLDVRIVGVTGSVGKTTTTAMCAAVLGTVHEVARTKDEWNAEIGVPLALLALTPQTEIAVIEMAMRGLGQIAELVEIARPEVGVVTNIGESHRELLGTMENIVRAKSELVEGLPADGTAVLNADDDRVAGLAARTRARVVRYGVHRPADVTAGAIAYTAEGMRFELRRADGTVDVSLPAWGPHSVSNALAAAAVAQVLGVGVQDVRRGLEGYQPPKMRLQPVRAGDILIINDAYNASPASMTAAFEVIRQVAQGRRRILVLGEMKELGAGVLRAHRAVGTEAAAVTDILIAVGGREAAALAEGAAVGSLPRERIHHVSSPSKAVELLATLLQPGDLMLVKGSRVLALESVVARIVEQREGARGQVGA